MGQHLASTLRTTASQRSALDLGRSPGSGAADRMMGEDPPTGWSTTSTVAGRLGAWTRHRGRGRESTSSPCQPGRCRPRRRSWCPRAAVEAEPGQRSAACRALGVEMSDAHGGELRRLRATYLRRHAGECDAINRRARRRLCGARAGRVTTRPVARIDAQAVRSRGLPTRSHARLEALACPLTRARRSRQGRQRRLGPRLSRLRRLARIL